MADDLARRQYTIGLFNRRVARRVANLNLVFEEITGEAGSCTFMCACGREGCPETITVSLEEYDLVRSSPHRFVIFPGHATEIDEVVGSGAGYEIVEILPAHRHEQPLTAEPEPRHEA